MTDRAALLKRDLEQRSSSRAFRAQPLERSVLDQLFEMAQRAPSWCNIQPWRVVITAPEETRRISDALLAQAKTTLPSPDIPFPLDYPEPYLQHRRECGHALYSAMGIARDDKSARYDAWLRNYELFDAPHLAVVSRDRRLGEYATLDVGVWLGYFFAAAASLDVDCCAMASVAAYPDTLRETLDIPDTETILFGIALGQSDASHAANLCRTTRATVDKNVRFVGF